MATPCDIAPLSAACNAYINHLMRMRDLCLLGILLGQLMVGAGLILRMLRRRGQDRRDTL